MCEVHILLHVASVASNVTITPVQVDPGLNCSEIINKVITLLFTVGNAMPLIVKRLRCW